MKRVVDVVGASIAALVLWPVGVVVAALIRWRLGGPVLFVQDRAGLHGETFALLKFRTMTNEVDRNGELLPDEERLSAFGQLLRSTSLDELPSLLNVLRGEMSLVGPRPLLPDYLPLYDADQRRRHEVLPGITGWAQVHGRNALSWEAKFELDVWYVDHRSFWLDICIVARTIGAVVRRTGIEAEGAATAHRFTGSQRPEHHEGPGQTEGRSLG